MITSIDGSKLDEPTQVETVRIVTVWGERRGYVGEAPELMVAWDECSVDENPNGFEGACAEEAASWGDDLVQQRRIILEVPAHLIRGAFAAPVVAATVDGDDR
ncbi:MAG: hypothetical protein J0J04_07880 [Microbacterium sp.]|uniref:hypothetical protein n=1 Tax=Microbacterium sp. TaxID=51671 RepID=UPI001ACA0069|nr:hypothetical protein [Microbacterium sp.]MBN9214718.1 hypothetical protein [Microbacterium sp.]